MGRPKGSKNKKPAAYLQPKPKSQFANTKMADQLHADFIEQGGLYAYPALRRKYETLFNDEFFCLISFDVAWKKLLRKVQEVHGVDYFGRYEAMMEAKRKPRNRNKNSADTDDQNP
jgi:hypothetical protein